MNIYMYEKLIHMQVNKSNTKYLDGRKIKN